MVQTVQEIYYEDDIQTLKDLQFYINKQFGIQLSKEALKPYFNEKIKIDEEDLQLQFKHNI